MNFNSNIPQDFRIDIQYQPVKTEAEKEFLRKMYEDPNFRKDWEKRNHQRWIDDPEYGKKVGAKISETYSTPEGRAIQASKSKPHTSEAKDRIRQANLGLKKSDEIKAKLSVKKKGNQNRVKPIVTPLGIFPSKKYAAEAYLADGKTNALRWIEKWLKTDKEHFFYISKQEYIMLTGKDI